MATFTIYQIECLETEQIYVGQTKYSTPFGRWADHVYSLRSQKSKHPKLQEAWNNYPDLAAWSFRVLDDAESKPAADKREAYYTLQVPEDKRLNEAARICMSVEKYLEVEAPCQHGMKYVDISQRLNVSMGQISKIRKKIRDGLFD